MPRSGGGERRLVPVVEVLAGDAAQVTAWARARCRRSRSPWGRRRTNARMRLCGANGSACGAEASGPSGRSAASASRARRRGGRRRSRSPGRRRADRDGQPAGVRHRPVDARAAGLDQLVAHAARQREVGPRPALSAVVQVAELAAPHVERGAAEARLDAGLDAGPGAHLLDDGLDGGASEDWEVSTVMSTMMKVQVRLKSRPRVADPVARARAEAGGAVARVGELAAVEREAAAADALGQARP